MSSSNPLYAELGHRPLETERVLEIGQARIELPELKGDAFNTRIHWRIYGNTEALVERAAHNPPVTKMALGLSGGRVGEIIGPDGYGLFEGQTQSGLSISLEHLLAGNYSSDFFTMDMTNIQLGFTRIQITHQEGPAVAYRRYVFTNVHFRLWPQATVFPDSTWQRDTLELELDGHTVRLTRLEGAPAVATVVIDEALEQAYGDRLLRALLLLLTFIIGVRVEVVAMESYGAEGELLEEELYAPDTRIYPARFPPIDWEALHRGKMYGAQMPVVMSGLLKQYLELDRSLLLSEVVGYIMTSKDTFPEISFALLSIALDSMANAYEKHYQPNWDKKMMEKASFKAIAEELKTKLEELLAHPDQAGLLNRFKSKVANMNQTGNANMFILFVQALGLEVTQEELDLFSLRNNAVHEGVLQLNRDSIDFQAMLDSLGKLVTVVDFCFLRLLGYSGLIVDYGVIGHPSKWIGDPPPSPTAEEKILMGWTEPQPPAPNGEQ